MQLYSYFSLSLAPFLITLLLSLKFTDKEFVKAPMLVIILYNM